MNNFKSYHAFFFLSFFAIYDSIILFDTEKRITHKHTQTNVQYKTNVQYISPFCFFSLLLLLNSHLFFLQW